jgi:hypothetical protein
MKLRAGCHGVWPDKKSSMVPFKPGQFECGPAASQYSVRAPCAQPAYSTQPSAAGRVCGAQRLQAAHHCDGP